MQSEKVAAFTSLGIGLSLAFCVALQWANPSEPAHSTAIQTATTLSPSLPGDDQALQQQELDRLQQDLGNLRQELERNTQSLQTLGELAAESAMNSLAQSSQTFIEEASTEMSRSTQALSDDATTQPSASPEEQYQAVQGRLEDQLAREEYDARWAPGMQDAITTTLQQSHFTGSELTGLACQSSLCRIDVQHENVDAEGEFLHQFVAAAGFTEAEAFYAREERSDGSVQMRYYVSRDGQRLPDMAQVY